MPKIKYYVNKFNGDIVSAFRNIKFFSNIEAFNLSQGLILSYSVNGSNVNQLELKDGVKIPVEHGDYIINDKRNIYTLPKDVFESCFMEIGENTCKVELNFKHNQNENIEEALKQFNRWFDKYLEDRLDKIKY